MTRTPTILGPAYDAPAQLAASLHLNGAKRDTVLAEVKRGSSGRRRDSSVNVVGAGLDRSYTTADGVTPWRAGDYEKYAAFYHMTPGTVPYARERAGETQDVILRIRYLEFVRLRSEPTGRAWIELQREILLAYREYVDGCRAGVANDPDGHPGLYIDHALERVGDLSAVRGLVPPEDVPGWAQWIVGLAEDSRSFPVKDPAWVEQQRHR